MKTIRPITESVMAAARKAKVRSTLHLHLLAVLYRDGRTTHEALSTRLGASRQALRHACITLGKLKIVAFDHESVGLLSKGTAVMED